MPTSATARLAILACNTTALGSLATAAELTARLGALTTYGRTASGTLATHTIVYAGGGINATGPGGVGILVGERGR